MLRDARFEGSSAWGRGPRLIDITTSDHTPRMLGGEEGLEKLAHGPPAAAAPDRRAPKAMPARVSHAAFSRSMPSYCRRPRRSFNQQVPARTVAFLIASTQRANGRRRAWGPTRDPRLLGLTVSKTARGVTSAAVPLPPCTRPAAAPWLYHGANGAWFVLS